ncbi:ankyrin repeat-containing domain protein [Lentinula lateritia]|nr:ankyrin repeat-containing domain protein [Lentinula lateritia]
MTEVLVENGANVNAQGGIFGNALQATASGNNLNRMAPMLMHMEANMRIHCRAAGCGRNLDIVKYLVDEGANVNTQARAYGNALQAAIEPEGNLDIVKFLAENGVNVNACGGEHGNALQAAVRENSITVKVLSKTAQYLF